MTDLKIGDLNRANTVKALEKKIIWKLDSRIMPLVTLIYVANALDKFNVGNAEIAGLTTDLKLHGVQFNTALSGYVSHIAPRYILSELPSNLVMKKFRSGRWLGFLAICWGLVTTFTGLMQNYTGFIIVRLTLGLFEGGLAPGILLYMSCLYKRHELQLRIGLLTTAGELWLLASIIVKMDGVRNLSGWRWIFILEGIATVMIGILIAVILPNDLRSAWFLSKEERGLASKSPMLSNDGTRPILSFRVAPGAGPSGLGGTLVTNSEEDEAFEWKEVKRGIVDIQTWLTGLALVGVTVNIYSVQFFLHVSLLQLPTIIVGFGYTGMQAQLYTALPLALASMFIIITSVLSDRLKLRGPIVLMATPLTIIGYTMVIMGENNTIRYVGCCFLAIGSYVSWPCLLTLLTNNSGGHYKRATATGMLLTFSALSGAIAPFLYTSDQTYMRGHLISLGFAILTWISTAANVLYCIWENKARSEGRRAGNVEEYNVLRDAGLTKAPIGDRHPNFKFTL
ncbi:MFS general substrate transporter [Amanita muscaria]